MLRKGGQFFMSTFFRQEVYVTEEELEKTYNYIKNMMDSKISQIQAKLAEMQQMSQQKEPIENQDIRRQILDISTKINETEKLKSKIDQIDELIENVKVLQIKLENINEEIKQSAILRKDEIFNLNDKIGLLEEELSGAKNQQINTLDISMQLEEMAQQTANKEQIELLKEKIKQLEETTSQKIQETQKEISIQTEKMLEIQNSINDDSAKPNEKSTEILKKLQEQIDIQISKIEAEIKDGVEEKLFEQNVEVQKVEQLLTLKMSKNSEETRNTREEIEKIKLKIEEIGLECKENENNRVTRYEIEKLEKQIQTLSNDFENKIKITEEKFNQELKIKVEELEKKAKEKYERLEKQAKERQEELEKQAREKQEQLEQQAKERQEELEKQNEEKIRKIVEEMLAKQKEEQKIIPQEENIKISQILATIK